MNDILNIAVSVVDEQRSIADDIRGLQSRLKLLDETILVIENHISQNTNLYYCESCKRWLDKAEMRRIDDDRPIVGGNKCADCCEDAYFKQLAKASINQAGISLYDAPEELIEIEAIRAKTRFLLKPKNKQNGNNSKLLC